MCLICFLRNEYHHLLIFTSTAPSLKHPESVITQILSILFKKNMNVFYLMDKLIRSLCALEFSNFHITLMSCRPRLTSKLVQN